MTPVLILSGFLLTVMVTVEILRYRACRNVSFITATHLLIAVVFCLPPFLIAFLPGTDLEKSMWGHLAPNPWGTRLYILDLADHLSLPPSAYFTTLLFVCGGYASMLFGYVAGRRVPLTAFDETVLPVPYAVMLGIALLILATVGLGIYGSQFPSVAEFFLRGPGIRSGEVSAKWGALQVLAQIALPAFLILVAASIRSNGPARWILAAFALTAWSVALARMWHAAGRLELGCFLIIPILATIFTIRSTRTKTIMLTAMCVLALLVGISPHHAFSHIQLAFAEMVENVMTNLFGTILYVLAEFGFPYITATHTLAVTSELIPFRYFIDIPLGMLYMLPNFSGVETLPPMILSLQAQYLPWMPVDLVSFGYYSLGTLGVMLIFAVFGASLALMDSWLSDSVGWLGQALRAAWLLYLPLRLLYADPYAALQSGFGLISGTILIAGLAFLAQRYGRSR